MQPAHIKTTSIEYVNLTVLWDSQLEKLLPDNGFEINSQGYIFPLHLPNDYYRTNAGVCAPVGFFQRASFHRFRELSYTIYSRERIKTIHRQTTRNLREHSVIII